MFYRFRMILVIALTVFPAVVLAQNQSPGRQRKLTDLEAERNIDLAAPAPDPDEWPAPWRAVVMGTNAMVAAEHPLQAVAGMEVLRAGGNAIDAAVAVFYMTSVVQQYNAGIGGGGYILAYIAKQNRVVFLNGAGPAPKLATLEFYQKLGTIPFLGPNSSIVPGMVGAFDLALKKYGTKDYKPLLQPAIRAAAEGHPLSSWSASEHRTAVEKISRFPSSVKILLNAGQPLKSGELFVQKDLARTLETIAREGADVFYRGPLARLTADFYEKQGGLLRYDDLASFRAEEAEPVKTTFRDLEVYQSAPNSQGIVMLMALNILEAYDLGALGHNTPQYLHRIVEALKLAFADRDHYITDPRFVKDMPIEGLLSKEYARQRRSLIREDQAIRGAAPPGDPRRNRAVLAAHEIVYEDTAQPIEHTATTGERIGGTSSFAVADRDGNLVSVTHSVKGRFGSGMFIDGGGYVLNNRMPFFSLSETDANVLRPGKRTLQTLCPALALKDGKPYLAWNTPGGDNQPQAMLQAFLNVIVFGMNVQQAVEAATVTSSAFAACNYPHAVEGKLLMPQVLASKVAEALARNGHRVKVLPVQQPYMLQPSGAGAVKMIMIAPGTGVMRGGVSPAKDDYVLGW